MGIITVTGKMYSGKTTTVEGISDILGDTSVVVGFSEVIRSYADDGLDALQEGKSLDEVADRMGINIIQAKKFSTLVRGVDDLRVRTAGVREALQSYGTTWVSGTVWASRLKRLSESLLNNYEIVLISGCRLKPEHDMFKDVAYQVRLDISPELQKSRALSRDGFVDTVAMAHRNETEIDNESFDLRFSVDGMTPKTVVDKVMSAANLE